MPDTFLRPLTGCAILIIEDSSSSLAIITQALKERGYNNLHSAGNGYEGLQKVRSVRPDIIILDLLMPEMDGYEFCRQLRAEDEFSKIPVIVQTAVEDHDEKIRVFELGASDFINKPFSVSELLARLKVHLTNRLLNETVVEQQRQTNDELRTAQTMQLQLMPDDEQIALASQHYGVHVSHYFETSSLMGGDCWGMRPIDQNRMALFMLDFSGHGITAALNVFRIHSLIHELLPIAGSPGQFLTTLNRQIHPLLARSAFATMFYGVMDTEANSFEYSAAASTPVLMLGKSGRTEWLENRGVPLGCTADASYDSYCTPLASGDALVLFSDCYIETKCKDDSLITEEDIVNVAQAARASAAPDHSKAILDALLVYFRDRVVGEIGDDLTLNVYSRV